MQNKMNQVKKMSLKPGACQELASPVRKEGQKNVLDSEKMPLNTMTSLHLKEVMVMNPKVEWKLYEKYRGTSLYDLHLLMRVYSDQISR